MTDHILQKEIAKADKAINDRDFETVANCYTEDAVLVVKPGTLVQGREALKRRIKRFLATSTIVSMSSKVTW